MVPRWQDDHVRAGVVRVTAWLRVLAAVGAALTLALLPDTVDHRSSLQLLTGAVWVPAAGMIALLADDRRHRSLAAAGAVADLLVIFVLAVLVEDNGSVVFAFALA